MFKGFSICLAALLVSISICVEGVKTAGSNIGTLDLVLPKNLAKASSCFPEFSKDQGLTVKKLGDTREGCLKSEDTASAQLNEDVSHFSYEMAKLADNFCVQIDSECRDKFEISKDILAALECYEKLTLEGRFTMLNMADQCALKAVAAENESRSIKSSKKNCTIKANYEYLITSDALFEKFLICEHSTSEVSTTTTLPTSESSATSPTAQGTTTTLETTASTSQSSTTSPTTQETTTLATTASTSQSSTTSPTEVTSTEAISSTQTAETEPSSTVNSI